MRVFRLCKKAFVALDGEGAKLHGGRWNFRGLPVVYTSSSLSLAMLEMLVHIEVELAPEGLICLEIEIPETVHIESMLLPSEYIHSKNEIVLKEIGSKWLRENRSAVLGVPSVIVPVERNFLINPLHPQAKKIHTIKANSFHFDPRLL